MSRQVIERNPDIETKMLPDGHVVLFSTKNDWAQTITPLAGIAWEFCDGTHTEDQIAEQVLVVAELDSNSAVKNQIHELIKDFEGSGLVFARQG